MRASPVPSVGRWRAWAAWFRGAEVPRGVEGPCVVEFGLITGESLDLCLRKA